MVSVSVEYLPKRGEWLAVGAGERFRREAARAGMRVAAEVTVGGASSPEPGRVLMAAFAGSRRSAERLLRRLKAKGGRRGG
ncbi:hypothetical protein [Desulfovirgula thermocuniculi]|uniref:hypothetical protein n=1 Tax=Desulfovirgula thermocuniculi TaxID=348842 RepID=UPI00042A680C|nr:hypothetical protein [Desulfovirgula thermocuniculi]